MPRLTHDGEIEYSDADEKRKNDERQREHELELLEKQQQHEKELAERKTKSKRTFALISLMSVIIPAVCGFIGLFVPVVPAPSNTAGEREPILVAVFMWFSNGNRIVITETIPISEVPPSATPDYVATSMAETLTAIATLPTTETVGTSTPVRTLSPSVTIQPTSSGNTFRVVGHEVVQPHGIRRIVLSDGELIAGTGDRFGELVDEIDPPCTAFVIKGPVNMELEMWWGGWDHYANAFDDSLVDLFLREKVRQLQRTHETCPSRGIRTYVCRGNDCQIADVTSIDITSDCTLIYSEHNVPQDREYSISVQPNQFHLWSSGRIDVSYSGELISSVHDEGRRGFISAFLPLNNQNTSYDLSNLNPTYNYHAIYANCTEVDMMRELERHAENLSRPGSCSPTCNEVYIRIFEGVSYQEEPFSP